MTSLFMQGVAIYFFLRTIFYLTSIFFVDYELLFVKKVIRGEIEDKLKQFDFFDESDPEFKELTNSIDRLFMELENIRANYYVYMESELKNPYFKLIAKTKIESFRRYYYVYKLIDLPKKH